MLFSLAAPIIEALAGIPLIVEGRSMTFLEQLMQYLSQVPRLPEVLLLPTAVGYQLLFDLSPGLPTLLTLE